MQIKKGIPEAISETKLNTFFMYNLRAYLGNVRGRGENEIDSNFLRFVEKKTE